MPKIARELTAIEVKNLKNGVHAVGGAKGLYIKKAERQAYFFLRYTDITKKRHDFKIGNYPQCSLKQARIEAHEQRKKIDAGQNPVELRKLEKERLKQERLKKVEPNVVTFKQIALEWVRDRAMNRYWSQNSKGEKETLQILKKHAFPILGELDIEAITPEDIRKNMEPIWQSIPATAKKTRTYINKIFQWAIALHKRQNRENPADMHGALGVLMESMQKNRKPKGNFAACSVKELPLLMRQIHDYPSMSAKAVEFSILMAARSQAVRLARWEEFDLEKGIWVVPVEHDKIKTPKRDRTLFLSSYAIKLLENLVRYSESPYVFTSNQGTHLSNDAMRMFIDGLHKKKLEEDGTGWIDPQMSAERGKPCRITVHGTARSTFKTWAKDDELGNNRLFDQEAVELCMLHGKKDAYQGAYDRARLPKERKGIMEAWGKYCYSLVE